MFHRILNMPLKIFHWSLSISITTGFPFLSACGANQWTGFYMIKASILKGLRGIKFATSRLFLHVAVSANETLPNFWSKKIFGITCSGKESKTKYPRSSTKNHSNNQTNKLFARGVTCKWLYLSKLRIVVDNEPLNQQAQKQLFPDVFQNMFFKIFRNIHGETLQKLQACRSATLLKRDFNIGTFLRILRNS